MLHVLKQIDSYPVFHQPRRPAELSIRDKSETFELILEAAINNI